MEISAKLLLDGQSHVTLFTAYNWPFLGGICFQTFIILGKQKAPFCRFFLSFHNSQIRNPNTPRLKYSAAAIKHKIAPKNEKLNKKSVGT